MAVLVSSSQLIAQGEEPRLLPSTAEVLAAGMRFPAGQRLTVYLGSTSLAQGPSDALYLAAVPPAARVTIGHVTLRLSVLRQAVSR